MPGTTIGIDTHLDLQRAVSSDLVSALASNSELLSAAALASNITVAPADATTITTKDGRQTESRSAFREWELPSTSGKPARAESWNNTINLQKQCVRLRHTCLPLLRAAVCYSSSHFPFPSPFLLVQNSSLTFISPHLCTCTCSRSYCPTRP